VDWLLSLIVAPGAWLLKRYRQFGSAKLPRTTRMLRTAGVFPVLHFYSDPLFNPYILPRPLDEPRSLPGIALSPAAQLELLSQLHYAAELADQQWDQPTSQLAGFLIPNGYYSAGDAEFLYQFLRFTRPRRVVEIGSGFSTRVAHLALERNAAETGVHAVHRCIEPYETERLDGITGIELITTPLEACDLDWSSELSAGDLLFIDSSHMIRPQGDVLKEYLEILPVLPSGVYIHLHDIFTPRDYPPAWLQEDVRFWNEQYLLEALLSGGSRYEVVAALNYLKHEHFDALARVCPYLKPDDEPGAFYIRVR
jgi:hypothetical protein